MPSSTTRGAVPRRLLQPQQRQRHADVVVQVAGGGERAVADARRAGSRAIICVTVVLPLLPVTAISGSCELRAPGRGECCSAASVSRDLRGRRSAGRRRAPRSASAADRAGRARCGEEVVAVEALAAQRDEQVARPQRARVAVHARRTRRRRRRPACSPAAARAPVPASRHARAPARARQRGLAPRARRRTAGARRRSPGSPRGPCRRCRTTSPGAASADRAARSPRAVGSTTCDASPPRDARQRSAPMIARGSSLRGLSLVSTTRSAPRRGDRAHQRPLGRVAVAAAAEHARQLPAALLAPAGAARAAALSSASGVCA